MTNSGRPLVLETLTPPGQPRALSIYCPHHAARARTVRDIEGITSVLTYPKRLVAYINPCYDLLKVAADVKLTLIITQHPATRGIS